MNTQNSHEDDLLARVLHGRVDGMSQAPLSFDDVAAKAHTIRRHRRMVAAGAVAAAVAAIALPAALLAGGGQNRSDELPPATRSETPSAVTLPVLEGGLDVSGLPQGEAPRVAWQADGTLHLPDGSTVPVPEGWQVVAPYDDGFLAINWGGERPRGGVLDATGTLGRTFVMTGRPAVSEDGDRVLLQRDDRIVVHTNSTGDDSVVQGVPGTTDAYEFEGIGFAPDGSVYYNASTGGPQTAALWRAGEVLVPDEALEYLGASSTGWTSELTDRNEDLTTCSVTRERFGGPVVGQTCELLFGDFSPNGELVLARPSYLDGTGDAQLAVVSRDYRDAGSQRIVDLSRLEQSDALFGESVFEDDEHVLVSAWQDGTWHLVRIGLTDGAVEEVADPVTTDDFDRPFRLLAW